MAVNGYAQNLVPNPSFELGPIEPTWGWLYAADGISFTNCDTIIPLGGPNDWTVTRHSPDRVVENGVQLCGQDIDTAAFDSCYVLFGGDNDLQYTEAGKKTLISALIGDSAYNLSYYTKRETWGAPHIFLPSRLHFAFNNGDTIVSPLISDTLQWLRFDTTFIASSSATELEIFCVGDTFCGVKLDSISLQKTILTSIKSLPIEQSITIYPNPTTNQFTIDGTTEPYDLTIYNSIGQLLFNETNVTEMSKTIDTSNYFNGILFVQINSANEIYTQKIIKN